MTAAPVQVQPVVIAAPAQSTEAVAGAPVQSPGAPPGLADAEVQLQPQPPPVEAAVTTATPAIDRLSDIDALLESTDEPIVQIPVAASNENTEAAAPQPSKSKTEAARLAAKKSKSRLEDDELFAPAKTAKPAKAARSPGKYWVQLAGGAKTERMPVEYKRIKGKKPSLFTKRTAYVAELKGWTRLLVGPFKSEDESQDYVNQLAKANIDGFSWTSPNSQTIEKLPPK